MILDNDYTGSSKEYPAVIVLKRDETSYEEGFKAGFEAGLKAAVTKVKNHDPRL